MFLDGQHCNKVMTHLAMNGFNLSRDFLGHLTRHETSGDLSLTFRAVN